MREHSDDKREESIRGASSETPVLSIDRLELGHVRVDSRKVLPAMQYLIQKKGRAGRSGVVLVLPEKQEPPAGQLAASRNRRRAQLSQKKQHEFLEVFAGDRQKRMEKDGEIRINQQE